MNGVTTAIVAFLFYGLVFPKMVKNRPQYYMALVGVLLVILLDAIGHIASAPLAVFIYFATALLQIVSIILLVMAAGGLSLKELGSELGDAYEVMRRGTEEKEVIIPLPPHIQAKADSANRRTAKDADEPKVYTIDSPPPAEKPGGGSIPIE